MTGIYQCPACQRPVTFRSTETRIFVCPCGTVLNRLESDDLVVKQALIIRGQNDLLMPGSKGAIRGKKFEVLGRFRLWLDESVMNYWTILIEGNAVCLLMEGYGMYALLRQIRTDKAVTVQDLDRLGETESLQLREWDDYFLQQKDACWKYEVEGEVWMPECKDQFRLFDLAAKGDKHIEMIEFLPEYLVALECMYLDFQSLQLTGLNEQPVTPLKLNCSQCNAKMRVLTFPYAQSCSCNSCGSRLVFKKTGEHQSSGFGRSGKDRENRNELAIPLGSIGTLKGIRYEVIGYALKEENTPSPPRWKEYVLYNRAEGYAFLSEYAGNWIYVRERGDKPVITTKDPTAIYYEGAKYSLYNKYQIRIVDTAGEFPYNVYDDKGINSAEFIAPPRMWIYEKSREEGINWFLGEHLDRDELLEQFPFDLPDQVERGVLDPRGFSAMRADKLALVTLIALGTLIAVHLLIGVSKANRVILDKQVLLHDSTASTSFVSSPFALTKWRSNLEIDIAAPVDNNWLDLEAALVNTNTGTEYSLEQVVQYYHGYEDGENWTEGSSRETTYLNSIPAGNYLLRVRASRDTSNLGWNSMNNFTLTVKNDVSNDRNLWIFIVLLLIWPIVQFFRMWYFEKRRWEGSAFSPYKSKGK